MEETGKEECGAMQDDGALYLPTVKITNAPKFKNKAEMAKILKELDGTYRSMRKRSGATTCEIIFNTEDEAKEAINVIKRIPDAGDGFNCVYDSPDDRKRIYREREEKFNARDKVRKENCKPVRTLVTEAMGVEDSLPKDPVVRAVAPLQGISVKTQGLIKSKTVRNTLRKPLQVLCRAGRKMNRVRNTSNIFAGCKQPGWSRYQLYRRPLAMLPVVYQLDGSEWLSGYRTKIELTISRDETGCIHVGFTSAQQMDCSAAGDEGVDVSNTAFVSGSCFERFGRSYIVCKAKELSNVSFVHPTMVALALSYEEAMNIAFPPGKDLKLAAVGSVTATAPLLTIRAQYDDPLPEPSMGDDILGAADRCSSTWMPIDLGDARQIKGTEVKLSPLKVERLVGFLELATLDVEVPAFMDCLVSSVHKNKLDVPVVVSVGRNGIPVAATEVPAGDEACDTVIDVEKKPCELSIHQKLMGRVFTVPPLSFFQSNVGSAAVLFSSVARVVVDLLKPRLPSLNETKPTIEILDLCCGTGTVGLSVLSSIKKIIPKDTKYHLSVFGVDICESAIEAAKGNAGERTMDEECDTTFEYVAGDIRNILPTHLASLPPTTFPVAIIDPPRGGVHNLVIKAIRACEAIDHLVYISCSPASLSIDLCGLCSVRGKCSGYGVPFMPVALSCFDMFPDTEHVETVVVFERCADEEGEVSSTSRFFRPDAKEDGSEMPYKGQKREKREDEEKKEGEEGEGEGEGDEKHE